MPSVTIYFATPYSLSASFSPSPNMPAEIPQELLPYLNVLFSVTASRLREVAKNQSDHSKAEGQASITIGQDIPGEGPVKVFWQNLGCPRDQMLIVAEWLAFKGWYSWFVREMAQGQQAQVKQAATQKLVIPGMMDFGSLGFGKG